MSQAAGIVLVFLIGVVPWLFLRRRKWILRVTYLGIAMIMSVPLIMLSGVALALTGITSCTAGGAACGAGAIAATVLLVVAIIASGFVLLSGVSANAISKKLQQ